MKQASGTSLDAEDSPPSSQSGMISDNSCDRRGCGRGLGRWNYHLYFDNFFSSDSLFEDLVENASMLVEIPKLEGVKGLPLAVKNTKLARH